MRDGRGRTPLHYAALNGALDTARLYLASSLSYLFYQIQFYNGFEQMFTSFYFYYHCVIYI